jgi:transcriptional regulator with XRE-family HTH domain
MSNPIPPQVSLRALRELLGLTLEQVAAAIRDQGVEITATGLNNAELGHRIASEPVMVAWAHALGIRRYHVRNSRELREWMAAADSPAPKAAKLEKVA